MKSKRGPLIAILDDEDAYREIVAQILKEDGYRVVAESNKARFYESLAQTLPDVIISDVTCSPMDGLTFLEKIKGDERYKTIPVIFATGYATISLRLYKEGAFAVFAKPVDIDDLTACVKRAIQPYSTS